MQMKYTTILITGGAGFAGSNLALSFREKYPGLKIIALDNLKRRGSELNVPKLKEAGIIFIHADIRNPEDLKLESDFGLLVDCSAEPAVLAGFGENPSYVINTNLTGTINCLELVRRNSADVIFISTSRVYPYAAINNLKTRELETRFEWGQNKAITGWSRDGIGLDFSLEGPKTLYGATKLASEIILQEYIAAYGLKGAINRCACIAGPGQFGKADQGVFTFWLLAHYFKRELNYIGFGAKGKQVRDVLHIDDLFELVDLEARCLDKISGKTYNVGGGRESSLSLLEATKLCEQITGNRIKIGKALDNRPGDLIIYITDNKKITQDLGWFPKKRPKETLSDIYGWIRENEAGLRSM